MISFSTINPVQTTTDTRLYYPRLYHDKYIHTQRPHSIGKDVINHALFTTNNNNNSASYIMTAIITAPSSPPGLDSSRSSTKSSSLRSSLPHDSSHDISHFEDISLTDSPTYFVDTYSSSASSPASTSPIKTRPPLKRSTFQTKSPSFYTTDKNSTTRSTWLSSAADNASHFQQHSSPTTSSQTFKTTRSQTLKESAVTTKFTTTTKRSSWQPSRRKSPKELEDEYDDLDEELPDDAIVWNIPLSPRPKDDDNDTPTSDKQPRPNPPKSRTKSWDTALSSLTPEIKKLTNDLDASYSSSTSFISPISPSTSSFTFPPPIQKSHNMVDPLPASREKEKFLTRTRPSWLPPKCPKEEKRHLKEYQQMMSNFLESEKRKSLRQSKSMANVLSETNINLKIWQTEILNNWHTTTFDSPRNQKLLWRGVPAIIRANVWTKFIGNDLHLSSTSYSAALARAKLSKASTTIRNIMADITSTFPSMQCFQQSQRLYEPLTNVLHAYAAYRSDTDYIRGTSGIAALLLHVFEGNEEDTFVNLANLMNRPFSLVYCLGDLTGIRRFEALLTNTVRKKMPHLADHFARLVKADPSENDVSEYSGWLDLICTSLFTTILEFDDCLRVWDILLFEGEAFAILAIVGILRTVEDKLYGCDIIAIDQLLGWQAWMSRTDFKDIHTIKKDGLDVGGSEKLIEAINWAYN